MDHGNLYIVATPIGNMQDITLRAIDTLKMCDVVVCEDTRMTGNLLHHYEIKKPMKALNEYNEDLIVHEIISLLEQGQSVCLVSDSGTPLISDPGFRLVRSAKKKGIPVIPIPGATAVISALSASGLPSDSFLFIGFLPKSQSKKTKVLEQFRDLQSKDFSPTLMMYESPHRLLETLQIIKQVYGPIHVLLARELTKIHEEIELFDVDTLIERFSTNSPKGEITLGISLKK